VAVWPENLPCGLLLDMTEAIGDGRLRSQPDMGPAIVRRRTSSMPKQRSGQMLMTGAQWLSLQAFGESDLLGWSLPFVFPHADGDLLRFADLPSARRVASNRWMVDLKFEVLP